MEGRIATTAEGLTADTPFSYVCQRCSRCCRDKLIQVNPYEIARLARRLGLSTTEFIRLHLEPEQPYLRRQEDGACVFLGPEGCTVHAHRPLVCRVYPLGRHVLSGTDESQTHYSVFIPQAGSPGEFGTNGTIAAYLAAQGAGPFVAAAGAYLDTLQALYDAWRATPETGDDTETAAVEQEGSSPAEAGAAPELLDLDRALEIHCRQHNLVAPSGLDERMALHLQLIHDWLHAQKSGD